ncbi:MAG: preprotein translocase subunit YajC [Crocinitomicaceae bacterium]|nr:preprotein translocase subunit YajC [Crocinitomicaceae bacterium]PDH49486.1 MAG: preprotein translocase subunit YajC [Bacteroidetes bacterium MED-G20]|tara:strand:+ start:480 stop:806 length:327 start_codon:yes stop_codon:yes gene_type:complete
MNKIFFLQVTTENDNSGVMNIIFLVVIFVIFYFFMVRPQNKKRKELQNMRDSLKKGQSIVTIGGIHGKISDVHESTVTVIVDSNTKIKVDKSSISMDSSTKLTEENKQ